MHFKQVAEALSKQSNIARKTIKTYLIQTESSNQSKIHMTSKTNMHIATKTTTLFGLNEKKVWDTETAFIYLQNAGLAETKRTAERRIHELQIWPALLAPSDLQDELQRPLKQLVLRQAIESARKRRERILFVQLFIWPDNTACLHANDPRNARIWLPLANTSMTCLQQGLRQIQLHIDKPVALFGHGKLAACLRNMATSPNMRTHQEVYPAVLDEQLAQQRATSNAPSLPLSPHLKRLEAESIQIIREAVAEAENPAMLYSIGKDSGVMLHLARKAFFPAPPPFPLLHVDTRWKFQEMYQFRDYMAKQSGMQLLVHINPESIEKNINPFDHGSALHTDITKTEGLKQALNQYKFDVVFGGSRRDEEKSRAKERVFSFRSSSHRWDPKCQRPELWNLYNTRKNLGESIRVFPLSNWTELDIWQYIYHEQIPMVPLYFAQERPVLVRDDMLMLVDDDRCQLLPDETIQLRKIRFRTLGCYPLTGAVESTAGTLEDILLEIIHARQSERQGRKIDTDSSGSMEKKKQEGYF